MRRLLMIIALTLLVAGINSCGGGGSSSTNTSGSTSVTINIGQTTAASNASRVATDGTSTIPSNVVSIKFTVSAPDMTTIERLVTVLVRDSISEIFIVPNGPDRYFLVEAMDKSGNVLYRGDAYATLNGTPTHLSITMVSTGGTPVTVTGTWELHLKCVTQTSDVAALQITLNESTGGAFTGAGNGYDYDGTPMHMDISGTYDNSAHYLSAAITTTFQGSTCVRVDTFAVTLTSNDTGYINTTQTQVCGCNAQVRMIKLN